MVRAVQVLAVFIVFASLVPPYNGRCSKEKAYVAAMKSDLRNLTSAQEQQLAEHGVYAASLSALEFYVSAGVTISIVSGDGCRGGGRAYSPRRGRGDPLHVYGYRAPDGCARRASRRISQL